MPKTATARLLVVEDDAGVADVVHDGLTSRGFLVEQAAGLAAARQRLNDASYDAIILDLALPDGSGLDLAGTLRSGGDETPIIILTAHDSVGDRVTGFRHGADDYICKPFEMEELAARLGAVLRRARSSERHVLEYGDVRLDLLSRTLHRGDTRAALSARETELLAYFLRHAEEVLPRDRILQEVWGEEAEDDSNVVNVYVNYLRNKLEGGVRPRLIHTVRGVGYILSAREPEQLAVNPT